MKGGHALTKSPKNKRVINQGNFKVKEISLFLTNLKDNLKKVFDNSLLNLTKRVEKKGKPSLNSSISH
jgi:dsDNA-binding SOS-regulon protein